MTRRDLSTTTKVGIGLVFFVVLAKLLFEFITLTDVQKNLVASNGLHSDGKNKPRIAYTTLSYGNNTCPAITAALNMREVLDKDKVSSATYDTDVIIIRIGEPIPEEKLPNGVIQKVEQPTKAQGMHSQWKHTYAKFYVARWFEYEAVVFLDSDVLLLRPLDEVVELTRAIPGSIVSPRAYWLKQPYYMSGTFLLAPSDRAGVDTHIDFDELLKNKRDPKYAGEMEWFNKRFRDELTAISGFYTLLCGEFYKKDRIYKYWGKKIGLEPSEVLDVASLVHFIAGWKPWGRGIATAKGVETKELKMVYEMYYNYSKRACQ